MNSQRILARALMRAFMVVALCLLLAGGLVGRADAQAKPEGEMRWALYVTVAPAWLDPGEVQGFITPFWIQYALHDALVKPMPGNIMTPSLAESWTLSPDQRTYEFKLRQGLKFHNGDPFTAEDVKFSFYRAKSSRVLKEKVRDVEIVDPYRVRFHLHEPFPDFMAFYGTLATASSWIVPKKYVEKVGDDGFMKQPVGLGPYKFVSNTPGIEIVMEANESYWRKMPSVKRLVFKSVPEPTTRAAMPKRGEVDIAYLLDTPAAMELKRDPNLKVVFSGAIGIHFLDFFDQWDPKSTWHDRRVRLAANYAIDRPAINQAETLGFSRITWSIIPSTFEFYWQPPGYPYDPARARQLLADAGYPNGFDAGDYFCDAAGTFVGEPVVNYLHAVGIRVKLRPLERAAFNKGNADRKYKNLIQVGSGAFGNAATRIEAFVAAGGTYVYGSYGDIDGLFQEQANEMDPKRRGAILERIQQLIHEKVMVAPIWLLAGLSGKGPRVEESGVGLIAGYAFSAPYEDVKLKQK